MKSEDHFLKEKITVFPYWVSYTLGHDAEGHPILKEERVDAEDEKAACEVVRKRYPKAPKSKDTEPVEPKPYADRIYANHAVIAVYWRPVGTKQKWEQCDQTFMLEDSGSCPRGKYSYAEEIKMIQKSAAYAAEEPHRIMLLPGGLEAYHKKQTPEFTCRVYRSFLDVPEEI